MIFIDGDFKTGAECKHHCSPTCHPAQVGPDWKYGCLHPDWPQNKEGDFCPIVTCGGKLDKCELPKCFRCLDTGTTFKWNKDGSFSEQPCPKCGGKK